MKSKNYNIVFIILIFILLSFNIKSYANRIIEKKFYRNKEPRLFLFKNGKISFYKNGNLNFYKIGNKIQYFDKNGKKTTDNSYYMIPNKWIKFNDKNLFYEISNNKIDYKKFKDFLIKFLKTNLSEYSKQISFNDLKNSFNEKYLFLKTVFKNKKDYLSVIFKKNNNKIYITSYKLKINIEGNYTSYNTFDEDYEKEKSNREQVKIFPNIKKYKFSLNINNEGRKILNLSKEANANLIIDYFVLLYEGEEYEYYCYQYGYLDGKLSFKVYFYYCEQTNNPMPPSELNWHNLTIYKNNNIYQYKKKEKYSDYPQYSEYKNEKLNGYKTFISGNYYINKYENGSLVQKKLFDYGALLTLLKETNYKNGVKNGKYTEYYNDDPSFNKDYRLVKIIKYYVNGKVNGKAQNFYENQKLKSEVNYINDKLNGIYNEWNEKGKLIKKITYKNNKIVNPALEFIFDNYTVKSYYTYKNNKPELIKKMLYDSNNNLVKTKKISFKNNLKDKLIIKTVGIGSLGDAYGNFNNKRVYIKGFKKINCIIVVQPIEIRRYFIIAQFLRKINKMEKKEYLLRKYNLTIDKTKK